MGVNSAEVENGQQNGDSPEQVLLVEDLKQSSQLVSNGRESPPSIGTADGLDGDSSADLELPSNGIEVIDLAVSSIRRGFYDKGEYACIELYLKSVITDSVQIDYERQSIAVLFRSSDKQFLAANGNKTEETFFRWRGPVLRGEINSTDCYHKLTPSKLEIRLKKAQPGIWPRLEQAPTSSSSSSSPAGGVRSPKEVESPTSTTTATTSTTHTPPSATVNGSDRPAPPKISLDTSAVKSVPQATVTALPSHDPSILRKYRVGMRGLVNQSNNCYQNSVIQILANSAHLREYCLERFSENDINWTNPLGSKGKMIAEFVQLIRKLWAIGDSVRLPPVDTAQSVGFVASLRFRPYFQHDAQEFVTYLLDTIHEDLNIGYGRPTPKKYANGEEPPMTAESAWTSFLYRNDSPLVEQYYGQICNKITCQHCFKESNAYDPFMMLPLPIARPSRSTDLICLYMPTPLSPRDPPICIQLSVPACVTSEEIKQEVRTQLNTSQVTCELKLYALDGWNLAHFWRASDVVAMTRSRWAGPKNGVDILIYETQQSGGSAGSSNKNKPQNVTVQIVQMLSASQLHISECLNCKRKTEKGDFPRCTRCQLVAYCGIECQKAHWKVHKANCKPFEQAIGLPLCFTVSQSVSYEKFLKMVEVGVKRSVEWTCNQDSKDHVFSKHITFEQAPDLDQANTKPSKKAVAVKNVEVNASNIQDALTEASSSGHVLKLRLVWLNGRASSCRLQLSALPMGRYDTLRSVIPVSQDRVSLHDCFRLYFEPELMHSANAWMCPQCKKNRTAIQRSLISRYPRYLICYLKRFSQDGYVHKDREYVSYPAILDVSSFVDAEAIPATEKEVPKPKEQASHSKRQRQASTSQHQSIQYHLYGVVNHYGTMQFGHYSSYGRLPALDTAAASEVPWRVFDDELVEETSLSRVIDMPDAYILFYQLAEPPKSDEEDDVASCDKPSEPVDQPSRHNAAACPVGEVVKNESSDDEEPVEETAQLSINMNDLMLDDDTVD